MIGKKSIPGLNKGLDEANEKGWTIVDMKKDWNKIYPWSDQLNKFIK